MKEHQIVLQNENFTYLQSHFVLDKKSCVQRAGMNGHEEERFSSFEITGTLDDLSLHTYVPWHTGWESMFLLLLFTSLDLDF